MQGESQGESMERGWERGLAEMGRSLSEWRREHPRATLTEIEDAVDGRMETVRAHMLEDMALASGAAKLAGKRASERPKCPSCGGALVGRGAGERRLTTTGGREVRLRRDYAACRECGLELFPPR